MFDLESPNDIKSLLFDTIGDIADDPTSYAKESAFSRKGKISFEDVMLLPMALMKGNTATGMKTFFWNKDLPTVSAVCQKRKLVTVDAFKNLFLTFAQRLGTANLFKGLRLVACDGSRLNLPFNPKDSGTYIENINNRKGINQMHAVTFYDIMNHIFLDARFKMGNEINEHRAFADLSDHYNDTRNCLFILDRGFSSFNAFGHAIHNNQHFLIRLNSKMDISKFIPAEVWEKEEFDTTVNINMVHRINKYNRGLDNVQCIAPPRIYDYLKDGKDVDTLTVRFAKIKLKSGIYEYLATNLSEKFTFQELNELYKLRWQTETSYRGLKYADALSYILNFSKIITSLLFISSATQ